MGGVLTSGLTALIGAILAYAMRGAASPSEAAHLTAAIRAFWVATISCALVIGWLVAAGFGTPSPAVPKLALLVLLSGLYLLVRGGFGLRRAARAAP